MSKTRTRIDRRVDVPVFVAGYALIVYTIWCALLMFAASGCSQEASYDENVPPGWERHDAYWTVTYMPNGTARYKIYVRPFFVDSLPDTLRIPIPNGRYVEP